MKKIIQGLLLLLLFTCAVLSFAEEIKITAIVPKPAGGPPKTGQTAQAPGYQDDGYYQMGNPVTPRFTDNGNGTVTDNVTGLMWEQKTNDSTIHQYTDTYTWIYVFDTFLNGPTGLNKMNAGAGFAGYTDWRIPNIVELLSIVDYGHCDPAIDPIFSTDSYHTNNWYWSSTSYPGYIGTFFWFFNFYGGQGSTNAAQGVGASVRAVRGGTGGLH